jgi:hypothetical protein
MLSTRSICLEVPEAVKPQAALAVANWNRALNGKQILQLRTDSCSILVIDTDRAHCPPAALACADAIGGSVIYLRRGSYEHQPANILAHELGHVLGAQHVEGALMSATGAPQACPDQTTVAQVAAYQHWNLAELCWCAL